VCEWPAVEIPVVRQEIDAQLILDAAEKARAMFGDGYNVLRDGRAWRLGADADVASINDGTSAGTTITSAIPPVFASYRTLELPETTDRAELARHEQAVIGLLTERTTAQPWWLGYLDTGASDVVFPYAPRTTIYYGYGYVVVEAGPQQAAGWRKKGIHPARTQRRVTPSDQARVGDHAELLRPQIVGTLDDVQRHRTTPAVGARRHDLGVASTDRCFDAYQWVVVGLGPGFGESEERLR